MSGLWEGYLEAPENGFFNLRIEADATATVTLTIDSDRRPLNRSGIVWTNGKPLELRAGSLYSLALTIEKVRQRPNPGLRILGVVITMHDKRTALARDIREQITKVFGGKVFRTVISKSVRLEESPAYKESIFSFAPESTGAAEYYRLCEEVMDRA